MKTEKVIILMGIVVCINAVVLIGSSMKNYNKHMHNDSIEHVHNVMVLPVTEKASSSTETSQVHFRPNGNIDVGGSDIGSATINVNTGKMGMRAGDNMIMDDEGLHFCY